MLSLLATSLAAPVPAVPDEKSLGDGHLLGAMMLGAARQPAGAPPAYADVHFAAFAGWSVAAATAAFLGPAARRISCAEYRVVRGRDMKASSA